MGVVRWSKEAFQMNQFSISAFPRCFSCVCVTEYVQGAYRRYISQSVLSTVKHESTQRGQVGSSVLMSDLVASGGVVRSSERASVLDFAQGVAYFLVRDFIHILYSLLTPSPPMIALYTASHIPATNAFFFRSLPSSRIAAVSNRSIRNAGLPAVPVVWPLLTGGEEALIG